MLVIGVMETVLALSTSPLADPLPTVTQCPTATPEPLWVEPVTSPTSLRSQVITVYLGNGEAVTVTAESGVFTAYGEYNAYSKPALVTVTLQVFQTHHLLVMGRVRRIEQDGCYYGGYTLSTSNDRFGNPLVIRQQPDPIYQMHLPLMLR